MLSEEYLRNKRESGINNLQQVPWRFRFYLFDSPKNKLFSKSA